ncbi:unnamed protein product, partial [Chrysoparadoxa australica]
ITKGSEDTVNVDSLPTGANVTFVEKLGKLADQYCSTPCTIELNRKYTYGVTFEKDGYKPVTGLLEPKLSGDGAAGMAGNILLGGIVGAAIDGSTGAMNDLKPNPMVAQLVAEESDAKSYIMGSVSKTGDASSAEEATEESTDEVTEETTEEATGTDLPKAVAEGTAE